MKPVRIRPAADADIDRAVDYLLRENPVAAAGFLDGVEAAFAALALHPGAGSPRYAPLLPVDGLRFWPVAGYPWLVFYFEREDHVDVVRVLHEKRDIPAALQDGGAVS